MCLREKKSAQIREILISESAWEEMTCLFAPSLGFTNLGKIRTSCNSTQINLKYRFINSNFTDPGEALNYYNKKKKASKYAGFPGKTSWNSEVDCTVSHLSCQSCQSLVCLSFRFYAYGGGLIFIRYFF